MHPPGSAQTGIPNPALPGLGGFYLRISTTRCKYATKLFHTDRFFPSSCSSKCRCVGKGPPLFTEIPRNIYSALFQRYSNYPVDIPKRIVISERPDLIDTAIITVDAMPPVRPNRLLHRCERPEMQKRCSSNYRPSAQSVVQDRFGKSFGSEIFTEPSYVLLGLLG